MSRLLFFALLVLTTCTSPYKLQEFVYENPVDTTTRPIEYQEKKGYAVDGVYADNRFAGARLNDFTKLPDGSYQVTIVPENTPINPSPWYAFKLWAEEEREVEVVLHYADAKHRYHPKLSSNGMEWMPLDSTLIRMSDDSVDRIMRLRLGPDTLWVAAQEIMASPQVRSWAETLAGHPDVQLSSIGKSALGRDLLHLDIGKGAADQKPTIVLLSRQHPPEVTGFLALQAFLAPILEDSPLANAFRDKYRILVYPLINPDGVDLGHWRHNTGGIDLNRDWAFYHQPEVRGVVEHILTTTRAHKNEVLLGLDFHSTWYDVYYTSEPDITGSSKVPFFKDYWLQGVAAAIEGYSPRDAPSRDTRPISKNWFVRQFGAEGITYEIGDDTPREDIAHKGAVTAVEMMQLLIFR
jgi:murein tripeptide amidase MpaA